MWLITNIGFYSIVQKPEDEQEALLTIRARVKADLENLRDRYLPCLGAISEDAGTDYKYRAKAPCLDLASALSQMTLDIDYGNFKDSVAKRQGPDRSKLYHEVWDVLHRLQAKKGANPPAGKAKRMSYGGVLLNSERQVLLRRPKGDFDGYVWTFAKGNGAPGVLPEETALREVKEETGYTAEIVGKLPLPKPFGAMFPADLAAEDVHLLPIKPEHIDPLTTLPLHHKDPFDRLIAATVLVEGLHLVSFDPAFDAYGLMRLW